MLMRNIGDGYTGYSNLNTDSAHSSVEHSLPSYEEAVNQELSRTTIAASRTDANNEHLAESSQIDYVSSINEHPSAPVSQYCGSHQAQLVNNYDGTLFQRRKEPNMCLVYIITVLVISMSIWATFYIYYIMPLDK